MKSLGYDFQNAREIVLKKCMTMETETVPLEKAAGRVCSEFVMCYPPGIPILAPGEAITREILDYIIYAKEKGCSMTGPEDPDIRYLNVLKGIMSADQ